MMYDVRHRTIFHYEQSVSVSQHVLHLQPRSSPQQDRLEYNLEVAPVPSTHNLAQDFFGNTVEFLSIHEPHTHLVIQAKSVVNVQNGRATQPPPGPAWEDVATRLATATPDVLAPLQFCYDSPYIAFTPAARDFAQASFTPKRPIVEAVMDLTARIFDEFEYQGGVSDVSTPVSTVLEMRKGVCQDFAHLEIACLRGLGLAARYVSGYLLTRPAAGQQKLIGSDASHAWASVWCGDDGWIDFDPTNRLIPRDEHITIAWGRDYGDVSPINGFIVGGGSHSVSVGVDVSPRN